MANRKIEPHLLRLLTNESVFIGALFEVNPGKWFTSLYSPDLGAASVLNPSGLYATGEGPTADDAIHAARDQLWNGL